MSEESSAIRGVYEVVSIPLGTVLTEKEISTNARILIAGKVPISVLCRINDTANPQIDLATYRALNVPITKLYLTTTETSTESLELLFSNEVDVTMLGLGASVTLVDSAGAVYNPRQVHEILADSTTTLLADGATYTGTQFATAGYNKIIGSVYSNATGTLYVDQSQDGTNYDVIDTIAYVGGVFTGGFSVEVVAPYARIRFIDTPVTAQTAFRLYAYLSSGA